MHVCSLDPLPQPVVRWNLSLYIGPEAFLLFNITPYDVQLEQH